MADKEESTSHASFDVAEIMRRRGALFLWVAAVVVLIGVAVAYRSTPQHLSRGVLLAEWPSVSEDAVRRMVQSRPAERVGIITQRVLTNDNLQEIIDKHRLYPDLKDMPAEARTRFKIAI